MMAVHFGLPSYPAFAILLSREPSMYSSATWLDRYSPRRMTFRKSAFLQRAWLHVFFFSKTMPRNVAYLDASKQDLSTLCPSKMNYLSQMCGLFCFLYESRVFMSMLSTSFTSSIERFVNSILHHAPEIAMIMAT